MRARKRSKLVSKGEATDSIGEATDLVTGNRGPTVGTAEDPLNYFLGKQLEKFPGSIQTRRGGRTQSRKTLQ